MATWPTSLPAPESRSYQEKQQNELLRTQMDAGPAKVRRRFTAATTEYDVRYLMSNAQVTTLMTFFDTTTSGGSIPFTMDNPRTGVSESYRFTQPPVISHKQADFYSVTVQLEKLPS